MKKSSKAQHLFSPASAKLFKGKSGQSIIEYTTVILLVAAGIILIRPYVIRGINAHMKTWEDAVEDSLNDPLKHTNLIPSDFCGDGNCNSPNEYCDSPTHCNCCQDCGSCGDDFCCAATHENLQIGTPPHAQCPQDCGSCGDRYCCNDGSTSKCRETDGTTCLVTDINCCGDCPAPLNGTTCDSSCCLTTGCIGTPPFDPLLIDPNECAADCTYNSCADPRCEPLRGEDKNNACADCARCGDGTCDDNVPPHPPCVSCGRSYVESWDDTLSACPTDPTVPNPTSPCYCQADCHGCGDHICDVLRHEEDPNSPNFCPTDCCRPENNGACCVNQSRCDRFGSDQFSCSLLGGSGAPCTWNPAGGPDECTNQQPGNCSTLSRLTCPIYLLNGCLWDPSVGFSCNGLVPDVQCSLSSHDETTCNSTSDCHWNPTVGYCWGFYWTTCGANFNRNDCAASSQGCTWIPPAGLCMGFPMAPCLPLSQTDCPLNSSCFWTPAGRCDGFGPTLSCNYPQQTCEPNGCYWRPGSCTGTSTQPLPCPPYTTRGPCELAGCTWSPQGACDGGVYNCAQVQAPGEYGCNLLGCAWLRYRIVVGGLVCDCTGVDHCGQYTNGQDCMADPSCEPCSAAWGLFVYCKARGTC